MKGTKDLADCIPKELAIKIRENGREQDYQPVYRVAKRGIIDEIAFMGTYEEYLFDNRNFNKDLNEIGSYSTSCYLSTKYPKKFLGYLKERLYKKYPYPIIIQGSTICGLSQLTIERLPDCLEEDHIDWWIYKDCSEELIQSFTVVEESEYGGGDLE